MSLAMPRPSQPYAEILRGRDRITGKPLWIIDRHVIDPRDGSVSRVTVAEHDSLRTILGEALALEKRGVHVNRGGLAR